MKLDRIPAADLLKTPRRTGKGADAIPREKRDPELKRSSPIARASFGSVFLPTPEDFTRTLLSC
jgi:hypothetical protein